jgi:hypothetical protein
LLPWALLKAPDSWLVNASKPNALFEPPSSTTLRKIRELCRAINDANRECEEHSRKPECGNYDHSDSADEKHSFFLIRAIRVIRGS